MSKIPISKFFETIGAPLTNVMWSWGSISQKSGDVFLKVWDDEKKKIDNKICFKILNLEGIEISKSGYVERVQQIDKIKIEHRKGFLVIIYPKKNSQDKRQIFDYKSDAVLPIIEIFEHDRQLWAEAGLAIKISELMV